MPDVWDITDGAETLLAQSSAGAELSTNVVAGIARTGARATGLPLYLLSQGIGALYRWAMDGRTVKKLFQDALTHKMKASHSVGHWASKAELTKKRKAVDQIVNHAEKKRRTDRKRLKEDVHHHAKRARIEASAGDHSRVFRKWRWVQRRGKWLKQNVNSGRISSSGAK